MQTTTLDEQGLRRADISRGGRTFTTDGFPVVLADVQTWTIPRVHTIYRADDSERGFTTESHFGREYDDLLEALDKANDADDDSAIIGAEMRLFSYLVRANYGLSTEEIGRLIQIDYSGDATPENVKLRRSLLLCAVGRDPNRGPSEPEPASTEATSDGEH
jgi:hypothetical protein